jgi:hypothetical protein
VRLEEIGGAVAEGVESVVALDHGHAFGNQSLELDRGDFRAVLLRPAPLLLVLVAVDWRPTCAAAR